jgi:KDO2-lipid IV(A) lauroyltransferase
MDMDTLKKILKERLENPSEQERDYYSYKFAIFKANIKKFLPQISDENYEDLFKKFLYYVQINKYDQSDFEKVNNIHIKNLEYFDSKNTPTIFITFHYGSYRIINNYFASKGYNLVSIVEDKVFNAQRDEINDILVKSNKYFNQNIQFELLNVKDTASIFKLKNLLKQGYLLVVYLDGNTSVKREFDLQQDCFEVRFLNNSIFVKKGILELAYILGATIVPVISEYIKTDEIILNFYDKIISRDFKKRSTFVENSVTQLYTLLGSFLKDRPEQWECWTYMQKWFPRNETIPYTSNKKTGEKFNNQRFSLFKLAREFYIFDMLSYRAFPITENIYNKLKNNEINKINYNELEFLTEINCII